MFGRNIYKIKQHLQLFSKSKGLNTALFSRTFSKQNYYGYRYSTLGFIGSSIVLSGVSYFWIYKDADSPSSVVVNAAQAKKKLVILGSGWGAVSLIKSLQPDLYDIKVVSPTNYFLFTPLLPSVTVGTVDGRSLTEPIRKIMLKKQKTDCEYYEAECIDIDLDKNQITCADRSGIRESFYFDYNDNYTVSKALYIIN